jgi:hypothetical protein
MVQEEVTSQGHSATSENLMICEIRGFHGFVEEDSSLIKCDSVCILITVTKGAEGLANFFLEQHKKENFD